MKEPANRDILKAVESVAAQVAVIDVRTLSLETRMDKIQKRIGEIDIHLTGEIHELNRRMSTVDTRLGSIEEILHPLSEAFDMDSKTLVQHGERIGALEIRFV